ncbi:ATP-binding protein [Streptomyces ochraceiscleroticus]|uniref:ATP-binding protein n=1 Tax=Streptomyces ochraceiscleroticus TaxID=47761 RepID=A0ABW1MTE9_9ACTN|nr:LuxR C-terminal-related transcriptional regulator [Streptomyces ochraceiscleroticus]
MATHHAQAAVDLPAEVTSFVGRAEELAAAQRMLDRARLVTLVGPGGVGKTRIALRTATQLAARFTDGVCLVELSALRDAALLPNTVIGALSLPEQSGRPPLDYLMEYLKDKDLLLVLDTCEHVVDTCGMLADALLRTAPDLRIMATSRQALSVPGENVLEVPPLGVPDEGGTAEETDAVRLFAQRAAAVRSGFTVDDRNRAAVGALCRRLDGIPLAIELATVRLRALSLDQLVSRLDSRFRLLTGGNRTALPRHQTLRTAIGWSHELCSPEERLLWARLSVFAGYFDLTAVEEVCADTELPADEILESLIGLVDKSIVLRLDDESGTCYRLLDTIREYGEEWLTELGEARALRARHRDHYLAMAEEFTREFCTSQQVPGYLRLRRCSADLRAALEFCFTEGGTEGDGGAGADDGDGGAAAGDARTGLRFAISLWCYWVCSSRFSEARYWLDKGLGLVDGPVPERAEALRFVGWFAMMQGEHDFALPLLEESKAIAEELADDSLLTYALQYLGGTYMFKGEGELALRYYGEARRRLIEQQDHVGIAIVHYQEALMHAMLGDTETSIELCDVTLDLLAGTDERWNQAWALWVKGIALLLGGDHDSTCEAVMRAALAMKYDVRDRMGSAHSLEVLAWLSAEQGRSEQTAWMLGATKVLYEKIGAPLFGIAMLQSRHDAAVRTARADLGDDAYDKAFRQGTVMPLDEVVARTQSDAASEEAAASGGGAAGACDRAGTEQGPSGTADDEDPAGPLGSLTRREREVAGLVAAGLSNRQIADRLVISKRTVDAHVEHILSKLGFSSRSRIAALVGEAPMAQLDARRRA